ncbi:MAG: hypothetical protein WBX78_08765, partial [Pseudolabrys sp.]
MSKAVPYAADRRRGGEVVLYAFDLIEQDGDELRDLPLIERKRLLAKLLGSAKRRTSQGTVRPWLEGIVSKRTDAPYRTGPSRTWLKSKNPVSEAVRREREESVTKFT